MKTSPYINGLYKCDWNGIQTIGKTQEEAEEAMLIIRQSFVNNMAASYRHV